MTESPEYIAEELANIDVLYVEIIEHLQSSPGDIDEIHARIKMLMSYCDDSTGVECYLGATGKILATFVSDSFQNLEDTTLFDFMFEGCIGVLNTRARDPIVKRWRNDNRALVKRVTDDLGNSDSFNEFDYYVH